MVAIPSRHKSLVLLAGVIVLQVLLLAVQIKRDSQGRLIRVWTVGAVTPFERAGATGIGGIRGAWNHYFALQNTSRENERLRHENDTLKLQINQLQSKAAEADRLAALLSFRQAHQTVSMVAAQGHRHERRYREPNHLSGSRRTRRHPPQHGRDYAGWRGRQSHRVVPRHLASAVADRQRQRSGRHAGRIHGFKVRWAAWVNRCWSMKYVANDDTVNIGERVVTSGMDRIFPRDLPVGMVAQIKAGKSVQANSAAAGGKPRATGRSDRAAVAAAARS